MDGSQDPEQSGCYLCTTQKVGVYILIAGGCLFFLFIMFSNWKEFAEGFKKIFKRSSPPTEDAIEAVDSQQGKSVHDTPPLVSTSIQPHPQPHPQPQPQQEVPPPVPAVIQPIPLSPGVPTTFKTIKEPIKRRRGIQSQESTGSHYFKQMIKGKKPVTSISQYLMKNKNKHRLKKREESTKKREIIPKRKDDISKKKEDTSRKREDTTRRREDKSKKKEETMKFRLI